MKKAIERRRGDNSTVDVLGKVNNWIQLCIWLGLGILLAMMISHAANTLQKTQEEDSSNNNIAAESLERMSELKKRLSSISGRAFEDISSPAHEALEWLTDYDTIDVNSPELVERYVLAVFYFAMHDDQRWGRDHGFLNASSICAWRSLKPNHIDGGVWCNANGKVRKIYLEDNYLAGTIATELGLLTDLEEFVIGGAAHRIRGSIPTEFGKLTNLVDLSIQRAALSGTLPTELGRLSKLVTMSLYSNEIRGTIPRQFGSLESLESMWLFRNFLTGTVPKELGRLSKLESLSLHTNVLTGPVPGELATIAPLESLFLYNNALEGDLNEPFCQNDETVTAIWADCGGSEPRVACRCCAHCCPHADALTHICVDEDEEKIAARERALRK